MSTHAPSQITDEETVRLLTAALNSDEVDFELLRARAVSTRELAGLWRVGGAPDGPFWRVALISVFSGETLDWDHAYTDAADAVAVWEHLAAEARSPSEVS